MRGNDISNRVAPTIGIRLEDFLVKFKDKTTKDKFLNFIVGKESRAEINEQVLRVANYIFRHTDMTVDLIMDKHNSSNVELLKKIEDIPYGRLIPIVKPVQVAILLNSGDLSYYVDDNVERISQVGHKYCLELSYLNSLLRRG